MGNCRSTMLICRLSMLFLIYSLLIKNCKLTFSQKISNFMHEIFKNYLSPQDHYRKLYEKG